MTSHNEKDLPFKVDDFLEYEADDDQKPSMKILIVSREIGEIFVTNGHGFHCFFNISRVLRHINDGRFTVKAGG